MKAQASIEFLALVGLGIGLFTTSVLLYAAYLEESGETRSTLEAHSVCMHVASTIGSVAAMEGYASTSVEIPEYINGQNYTVWVVSNRSLVKVDYKLQNNNTAGVGCRFPAVKISKSGSSTFTLPRYSTIDANYGVLDVIP